MLDHEIRESDAKERLSTTPVKPANRGLIIVIGVLTVALIGVAMWAFAERNEAEDSAVDLAAAEARIRDLEADVSAAESQIAGLAAELAESTDLVVVGGGPITPRQEEMVALVAGPWSDAWSAADGNAAASFFTPDGVLYDFEGGEVLTVADGTVQSFAARWSGLEHMPGMLIHGDRITTVVEWATAEAGVIIDFTRSGDLLVESVAMYNSVLN